MHPHGFGLIDIEEDDNEYDNDEEESLMEVDPLCSDNEGGEDLFDACNSSLNSRDSDDLEEGGSGEKNSSEKKKKKQLKDEKKKHKHATSCQKAFSTPAPHKGKTFLSPPIKVTIQAKKGGKNVQLTSHGLKQVNVITTPQQHKSKTDKL